MHTNKKRISIWVLDSIHLGEKNTRIAVAEALKNTFLDENYIANIEIISIKGFCSTSGDENGDGIILPNGTNLELLDEDKYQDWPKRVKEVAISRVIGFISQSDYFTNNLPDIVVSSWKYEAPIAVAIKRYCERCNKKPILVNIDMPHGDVNEFDLIAARPHIIEILKNYNTRVLELTTVPSQVNRERLIAGYYDWKTSLKSTDAPLISVFLGGNDGGGYVFSNSEARKLGEKIRLLANMIGGKVAVSNSPRTMTNAYSEFCDSIGPTVLCYDIKQDVSMINPFFGMLACGDVLITTGESLSLIADVCATPSDMSSVENNSNKICLIHYPDDGSDRGLEWSQLAQSVVASGSAIELDHTMSLIADGLLTYESLVSAWKGSVIPTAEIVAKELFNIWAAYRHEA